MGRDNHRDNLGIYDDRHAYCFSCKFSLKDSTRYLSSYFSEGEVPYQDTYDITYYKDTMEYTKQYVADRSLTRGTMEFYGVETKVDQEGKPVSIAFPYGSYLTVRTLPHKNYTTLGDGSDVKLFGQDKFNPGSATAITITEGAYDAMAIYQALGSKYPSVSVRSSGSARADCERAYNYLNSFERIYICFDNDTPGMGAAKDVAALFDVNKVYHVKLEKWKDASEAYQKDPDELRKVWYNAKKYQPKGVVDVYDEASSILSKEDQGSIGTYPFPTLDSMAYGIRQGELVLVTALEKVGKTEVLRSIEYHILKTTDANIGVIHLEEQEKRSVQGLIGYELGVPAHLPDAGVSLVDQERAIKSLVGKSGRLFLHSHFGSDDPDDVIALVRYLASVNKCKFIFLDHLTMLVSGMEGDDERRKLDYLSTRLARLTRELNFTLFLVSHVNDEGQTRGSRMPSKLCDIEVYLSRDKETPDNNVRNTIRLMVRNNRFGGATGPAGILRFDPKSFTLKEQEVVDVANLLHDQAGAQAMA